VQLGWVLLAFCAIATLCAGFGFLCLLPFIGFGAFCHRLVVHACQPLGSPGNREPTHNHEPQPPLPAAPGSLPPSMSQPPDEREPPCNP
jgi:hypothetical protein